MGDVKNTVVGQVSSSYPATNGFYVAVIKTRDGRTLLNEYIKPVNTIGK